MSIGLSMGLMLLSPVMPSQQVVCQQTEFQKITASTPKADDFFGFSVALSGDRLLVGAQGGSDDKLMDYATVFLKTGKGWISEAKVTGSDSVAGDNFGGDVDIEEKWAIIGARRHDALGADAGAAYLFKNNGSHWRQFSKLTASDGAVGDEFGYSVAIDGGTIAIGAPRHDRLGDDAGTVYIFENDNGQWQQTAALFAPDGAPGDVFGISLSLSNGRLLIGADLTDEGGENAGAAYVFERAPSGWQFETKLTASDAEAGDLFGIRVSLDADRALIGAAREDELGDNAGAAYLFTRTKNGWQQDAKLTAPDGANNDRFGTRVALSANALLVGSILNNTKVADTGAVYLYQKRDEKWQFTRKLVASNAEKEDVFGWGLTIQDNLVVVGAPTFIVTKPGRPGAIYMYDLSAQAC